METKENLREAWVMNFCYEDHHMNVCFYYKLQIICYMTSYKKEKVP